MSKKPAELSEDLPEILRDYLATVPPVTEAMRKDLRAAAKALDHDPKFQAEYIKGLFVNFMFEAMNDEKLSQSEVARKWGRSRQYLHKLLNEDKRVNFTVETMVELAMLLGRRIEMNVLKQNEAAHVLRCVTRPQKIDLAGLNIEPFAQRTSPRALAGLNFEPVTFPCKVSDDERLSA